VLRKAKIRQREIRLHRAGAAGGQVSGIMRWKDQKGKGCDFGYALAANSCEGVSQCGCMYRHSP
jgi:hypothetical protein